MSRSLRSRQKKDTADAQLSSQLRQPDAATPSAGRKRAAEESAKPPAQKELKRPRRNASGQFMRLRPAGKQNEEEEDEEEEPSADHKDDSAHGQDAQRSGAEVEDTDEETREPEPPRPKQEAVIKVKSKSAKNTTKPRPKRQRKEVSNAALGKARAVSAKRKTVQGDLKQATELSHGEHDNDEGQGDYDDSVSNEEREPALTVDSIPQTSIWRIHRMKLFDNSLYKDIPECIHQLKDFWNTHEDKLLVQTKLTQLLEIHKVWNVAVGIIKNESAQNDSRNDFRALVIDLTKKLEPLQNRKSWTRHEALLHDFYYMVFPSLVLLSFMTISILTPTLELVEEELADACDAVDDIVSFLEAIAQLQHLFIRNIAQKAGKDIVDEYSSVEFVQTVKSITIATLEKAETTFKHERDLLERKMADVDSNARADRERARTTESSDDGRHEQEAAQRRKREEEETLARNREMSINEKRRQRVEAQLKYNRPVPGKPHVRVYDIANVDRNLADELDNDDWEAEWQRAWDHLGRTRQFIPPDDDIRDEIKTKMADLHARRLERYRGDIWKQLQILNGERLNVNVSARARVSFSHTEPTLEPYNMTEEDVEWELRELAGWLLDQHGLVEPPDDGEFEDLQWTKWFV